MKSWGTVFLRTNKKDAIAKRMASIHKSDIIVKKMILSNVMLAKNIVSEIFVISQSPRRQCRADALFLPGAFFQKSAFVSLY